MCCALRCNQRVRPSENGKGVHAWHKEIVNQESVELSETLNPIKRINPTDPVDPINPINPAGTYRADPAGYAVRASPRELCANASAISLTCLALVFDEKFSVC